MILPPYSERSCEYIGYVLSMQHGNRQRVVLQRAGWSGAKKSLKACYEMLHWVKNFAGSCEHGYGTFGSREGEKFLDFMSDSLLLSSFKEFLG
jgi:hypothetical protein